MQRAKQGSSEQNRSTEEIEIIKEKVEIFSKVLAHIADIIDEALEGIEYLLVDIQKMRDSLNEAKKDEG